MILSAVCLAGGIAGGWAIRGTHNAVAGPADAVNVPATDNGANLATQAPNPARLKEMADAQAAPLLAQLKSDPANPDLLTSLGNLYYDAQQYPAAVDYYGRALAVRPADPAVRTDMGTAYWYMGNADSAIAEFNQVLTYAPNNPNTLFNLGLVKWKAKKDSAGAVAAWEKLLAANPNYEGKDKVEQMLAEVRGQTAVKPGTKAN
jgi:tetratricopeptide (TPR) repeat protein